MNESEFSHILAAFIVLAIVIAAPFFIGSDWPGIAQSLFFAAVIMALNISAKKIIAYFLDADVEHELWKVYRYGFFPGQHFKKEIPAGIIVPLLFSLLSLGKLSVATLLTYETKAKKIRAAKRFGYYSYTEITELHNGLIGAAGIIIVLILAVVTYFLPANFEYFAKIAVFYALFNLIPISNLDGSQIFFGSRVLWTVLATITLIFTVFSILIL